MLLLLPPRPHTMAGNNEMDRVVVQVVDRAGEDPAEEEAS